MRKIFVWSWKHKILTDQIQQKNEKRKWEKKFIIFFNPKIKIIIINWVFDAKLNELRKKFINKWMNGWMKWIKEEIKKNKKKWRLEVDCIDSAQTFPIS